MEAVEGGSVGLAHEGWFAVLIRERGVCDTGRLVVAGEVLGSESAAALKEVAGILAEGHLHFALQIRAPLLEWTVTCI